MSRDVEALALSGDLEKDSPACFGMLRRTIGVEGAAAIAALYRGMHQEHRLTEEPISREPGVSFNPRAARVCQLVMSEGSETDPEVLAASMQAACFRSSESELPPGLAASVLTDLKEARWPKEEAAQGILLALLLDDVRHLHMSALGEHERFAIAERAARFAAESCSGRLEPLSRKLRLGIDRFTRSRTA